MSDQAQRDYENLFWLNQWIDQHPVNAARDREAALWGRVSKVGEEFGETIQALIGATGQNPRKGMTHTIDDVTKELYDVALTALCAILHIDPTSDPVGGLSGHIEAVTTRAHKVSCTDECQRKQRAEATAEVTGEWLYQGKPCDHGHIWTMDDESGRYQCACGKLMSRFPA